MPNRAQVHELLGLGRSYEAAGRELGIPAGLVYLIATGLPADGSEATSAADLESRGAANESTQRLINPRLWRPGRPEELLRWVRERAARELTRGD